MGDSRPLIFVAKPPHFFKIIGENSIRDGKLMIPKRFVKKYGKGLKNLALLKVPSGREWQINLTNCDGKVWLQKGWKDFAAHYSLAYGHLLAFEYVGNCYFNVIIFDMSATEIDYPLTNTNVEQPPLQGLKTEETNSVGSLGRSSLLCRKTRKKSPLPCPRPQKMMSTDSTNRTLKVSELQNSSSVPPNGAGTSRMKPADFFKRSAESLYSVKELDGDVARTQTRVLGRPLTHDEKAEVLQRTDAFKSKNSFFKVAMYPSYICNNHRLTVPRSFARKYFTESYGKVTLCVADGRTWPAKYYNNSPPPQIFHGWKAFAQENNLRVGDVCIFELINAAEISLNVVIFRINKNTKHHLSLGDDQDKPNKNSAAKAQLNCSSKDGDGISSPEDEQKTEELSHPESDSEYKVEPGNSGKSELRNSSDVLGLASQGFEAASRFVSTFPFFRVVLRLCYFEHRFVQLPFSFIERHIKEKGETVMLQVADRTWPVKLISYLSRRRAVLSAGWTAFAKENSLKVGDVCTFELIKSGVLKVSIFRDGC